MVQASEIKGKVCNSMPGTTTIPANSTVHRKKELSNVPKKVRTALKFHFVDTMDDMLKIALPEA